MRGDCRQTATLVLVLAAVPASAQEEKEIDMARVPAPVRQAAMKAAPGARLTSAFKETDEGRTTYELSGRDAQGRGVEIEVTGRGVVLGVETEIPVSQVPRVVIDALRAKARGMKFTSAEVVTRNGRIISYEFEGEDAAGDEVEANVSPDGRTVDLEVDDED